MVLIPCDTWWETLYWCYLVFYFKYPHGSTDLYTKDTGAQEHWGRIQFLTPPWSTRELYTGPLVWENYALPIAQRPLPKEILKYSARIQQENKLFQSCCLRRCKPLRKNTHLKLGCAVSWDVFTMPWWGLGCLAVTDGANLLVRINEWHSDRPLLQTAGIW